jgi:hypothetical protein
MFISLPGVHLFALDEGLAVFDIDVHVGQYGHGQAGKAVQKATLQYVELYKYP